ncbi:early nodulin 1 [Olea europaea subsp. europaea]|uniref:Early nodulin 1 n=1 Tax=Olea europaea subsp. europaea TaxID=158383 RepID=A0A8S0RG40_OLEEU|nr:early nodulin 1 [Olea europaea subsp. europaea]
MSSATITFKMVFLSALFAAVLVNSYRFDVGDERGWTKPTGKDPQTYNQWAAKNRFRIGDTVHFKYQNDSVLEVTSADYLNCNTSNPISKFEDGDTVFQFDRSGFFYFISGQPDNCKAGQKIIIRVMHPSEVESPGPGPSPGGAGGGWDSDNWEPPRFNATSKLFSVSYFMTVVVGLFVVLYMFM